MHEGKGAGVRWNSEKKEKSRSIERRGEEERERYDRGQFMIHISTTNQQPLHRILLCLLLLYTASHNPHTGGFTTFCTHYSSVSQLEPSTMKSNVVPEAHLPCNLQESLVDAQPPTIVGREHQRARHGHKGMVGVNLWHISASQDSRVSQKPTTHHQMQRVLWTTFTARTHLSTASNDSTQNICMHLMPI